MFQGTVEICLDNVWCLVAEHGWDDNDARVVCRKLGGYNASGMFMLIVTTSFNTHYSWNGCVQFNLWTS